MDMNIIMNDSHIVSMWQVEESVKTAVVPTFSFDSHQQAHAWVSEVLDRFRYFDKQRTKKEKVLIRAYITRYAAYSVSQLTRLVKEKKETGTLKYGKGKKKHQFKKIYTPEDARLLVLADNAYRRMSEDAMRAVFRDEYALYGKNEYERLSKISHGHFYRLRATDAYKENALTIGRTISEESMAYVLHLALGFFPFIIAGFHSDNGGENINGSASAVLQKLLIEQT